MARLKDKYKSEIAGAMKQKFGYENVMQIPKLEKIVINMGLGNVKDDSKKFEAAVSELALIAGQRPLITKAKKSVANFKVRQGMNIGAKVTLLSLIHIFNLEVARVDAERGVILVKGAVPGADGALVTIRQSVKSK